MKKFLAIILTVVMLFAVAVPVFATSSADPFAIGSTTYATLAEAIAAAKAGDTIEMTADVSESYSATRTYTINKSITIDGKGNSLTLTSGADNQFAFYINTADTTVEFKNFKKISTTGGLFEAEKGTLKLTSVTVSAKGRAALKLTGPSTAIADASTITFDSSAAKGETTAILYGAGDKVLTLTNGSVLEKTNTSNDGVTGAGAALYTYDSSNITINVQNGSKIVANHASGAKGSVIGNANTGVTNVNVDATSALVLETAALTSSFSFIANSSDKALVLNIADGALLVKEGVTTTLNNVQGGLNDNEAVYTVTAVTPSAVEGYSSYKLVKGEAPTSNYEIVNPDGTSAGKVAGFATALAAAKTGSTIKLLHDTTCTESGITIPAKTLTFDLCSFTWTNTADAYVVSNFTKGNFTFKNGTVWVKRGFYIKDKGVLNFDGVTGGVNASASGQARPFVKLNNGTCTLNINNSNISTVGLGEALILCEGNSTGTINLTGTTTLTYKGGFNQNQNNTIIAVQTGTQTTSVTINVGSQVTLEAKHNATTSGKVASIIVDQTKGNIVLNLDKGATLKFDRTPGDSTNQFFNKITADGTFVINDKGANYVLSADSAKKGITLPAAALGYTDGTNTITDLNYINAEATEAVSLTAIEVKLSTLKGAAIRTVLPYGMQFTGSISADMYALVTAADANAKFGFVVTTANKAGDNFEVAAMAADQYYVIEGKHLALNDGNYTFDGMMYFGNNSPLTSPNKTNFQRKLAVRAFVEINGVRYYADFDAEDNVRSIYFVAKSYYEDAENGSTTNVVINHILETCDYFE